MRENCCTVRSLNLREKREALLGMSNSSEWMIFETRGCHDIFYRRKAHGWNMPHCNEAMSKRKWVASCIARDGRADLTKVK